MELVREVIEEDIPRVKELLRIVGKDDYYKTLERLGGMTNHSYKVQLADDEELLVRIPGEGTEEMINRTDERKSTELACNLGLDTELLYFGDEGTKVMRFIHNPQPMDEAVMKQHDIIPQAAEIFYKLHHSGVDTGVRFEVFEMAALYENIIRDAGVAFYEDYDDIKNQVFEIKNEIDAGKPAVRVPCHNDSLVANWVLDESGKLFLVDWEYSGMNEPMWDLACLSIEANYDTEDDDYLLECYFKRTIGAEERKAFIAAKLYVDYLWTLWGLTRVPFDGQFMQEYADERYARLKKNIEAYEKTRK